MPRIPFTPKNLKALKPPAPGPGGKVAQVDHFDESTPGLGLRISSNNVRSWFFLARTLRGGRRKLCRWGLGRVAFKPGQPGLTLAEARAKALEYRRLVDIDEDPKRLAENARREKAEAQRNSFKSVREEFIEKYAKPRQRTWPETQRVLKSTGWDGRAFAEITKADAYILLDGFVAAGHERKAAITLMWLRTLWRWAWKRDYVTAPLMDAVEIETQRRVRDRFYSDAELKALWKGTAKLTHTEAGYIKLLTLLGVRKSELAGVRRSEFNDPDKPTLWTVPTERVKLPKRAEYKGRVYLVPLPPLAQQILAGLKPDEREDGDPDLVFPGRVRGKPLDPGSQLQRRVQDASGIEDWAYHPHRHTISTWLQNAGHSEYERGLALNHAGPGTVTAGYSHGYPLKLKTTLMRKWANHVAALVTERGQVRAGRKVVAKIAIDQTA